MLSQTFSSARQMGVGKKIYSGTAGFGRVTSWIRAVVGTLLAIVLIVVGAALIRHKGKLSETTDGTVKSIAGGACVPQKDPNESTQYQCSGMVITYNVGGKSYSITVSETGNTNYVVGQTNVSIHYDPNDPKTASLYSDDDRVPGYIALCFGILILFGVWINVYLTSHYKSYAAVEGVATGVGMLSDVMHH